MYLSTLSRKSNKMKSLSAIKSYSSHIDDYSIVKTMSLMKWQNKEMSFEKLRVNKPSFVWLCKSLIKARLR